MCKEYSKNSMRSGTSFIHISGRNSPSLIPFINKVVDILITHYCKFAEVLNIWPEKRMLSDSQVALVFGVEEVSNSFAVNFHVADLDGILDVFIAGLTDSVEEVFADLWDDAFLAVFLLAHHCVGFPGACLAICENADVVAVK